MTSLSPLPLPIDRFLPEIARTLGHHPSLVLQAEPGAGKTTRVPSALLHSIAGEIWVLEPRRLAAKFAARRVAEELGEALGETVGYHFRFEQVSGPRTRLRFLTEGMLLRRLISNPLLREVGAVILDEFHERHLHTDVALAYLRALQLEKRPDLRLVVMSATLDSELLSRHLGNAPIVKVDGRQFPVELIYRPAPDPKRWEIALREAVLSQLGKGSGNDILVFLPGMAEIRRAADCLERDSQLRDFLVVKLHGDLGREEQDLAVRPALKQKVILSTNIAETSLTIEGVTCVVDLGLHRLASYSWWSGVPKLQTRPISRASAIQRAGRAGRLAPGTAIRLYSKADFESRPAFDLPEIRRADLAQTVLELKALNLSEVDQLPWLEPPDPASLSSSRDLLYRLGATDEKGAITPLGRKIVEFPLHPRLGRCLIEAQQHHLDEEACAFIAALSEGRFASIDALEAAKQEQDNLQVKRLRQTLRATLNRRASREGKNTNQSLGYALLMGFPDRIAQKRAIAKSASRAVTGKVELVLSSGGSTMVDNSGIVAENDFFIALEIEEQKRLGQAQSELRVRSLCPIAPEWLFDVTPGGVKESHSLVWKKEEGKITAWNRLIYDNLVLDSTETQPADAQAAGELLLKNALGLTDQNARSITPAELIEAMRPLSEPGALENTLGRILLLARHAQELGLPELSWDEIRTRLVKRLGGHTSLKQLKERDWCQETIEAIPVEYQEKLHRLTPATITLPAGRKTQVNYPLDRPPWIQSRLQDFFGMETGPTILGGRHVLILHLLAPNRRAVQVTQDLAGFWERAYPTIRKELSRKYPRHSWPEKGCPSTFRPKR